MPGISPNSVAVLGVPFNNVTMEEAVAIIEQKIDEGGFHQVATANVDFLMHAIHDQELQNILCSCSLVVPDGMPILWSARLMGSDSKSVSAVSTWFPAWLSWRRGAAIASTCSEPSEKSSQRASEICCRSAIRDCALSVATLRPFVRSKR